MKGFLFTFVTYNVFLHEASEGFSLDRLLYIM